VEERQAAIIELQRRQNSGRGSGRQGNEANNPSSQFRIGLVLAARQRFPQNKELLTLFWKDQDALVKRLLVQWVAEEKLKDFRPQLEAILSDPALTSDLFLATLAGLEMLDGVNPTEFDKTPASKYVLPLVQKEVPAGVRTLALRMVSPSDPALTVELFEKLLASPDERLRLEVIRTLQLSVLPRTSDLLVAIAGDPAQSEVARAEAIAGLTAAVQEDSPENSARKTLNKILLGDKPVLKIEALRTLRGVGAKGPEALVIKRFAESLNSAPKVPNDGTPEEVPQDPLVDRGDRRDRGGRGGRGDRASPTAETELEEQIQRALAEPKRSTANSAPSFRLRSLMEWNQIASATNPTQRGGMGGAMGGFGGLNVEGGAGPVGALPPGVQRQQMVNRGRDPAAGRRVFFHANSAGCYKCHTVDGRGGRVGPDLTTIARTMDRTKLIQSILEPSREISPQFTSWNFELTSGQVLQGLLVSEESEKIKVATADGKMHDLTLKEIESRAPQSLSLMPEKLYDQLTMQEFLDLIAFLETLK
ncbi:MAG: Cytochrome c, partial [Planctomycetaceae bacterium]|nr:Cytochrome c [Planctomycetaceae bacterium]